MLIPLVCISFSPRVVNLLTYCFLALLLIAFSLLLVIGNAIVHNYIPRWPRITLQIKTIAKGGNGRGTGGEGTGGAAHNRN
jgi:hypothetical protein